MPGHAHADSLSFELSLDQQRILVNSGTSVYGIGTERQQQRGTAAHNTIQLDGMNSSDVWSGFRVGRRARVQIEKFETQPTPLLQAAHDGYRHLPGHPAHHRLWEMKENELTITDTLEGKGNHFAEVFFHFHPDYHLTLTSSATIAVQQGNNTVVLLIHVDNRLNWEIKPGLWHPSFGQSENNIHLHGQYRGFLPIHFSTLFSWKR